MTFEKFYAEVVPNWLDNNGLVKPQSSWTSSAGLNEQQAQIEIMKRYC